MKVEFIDLKAQYMSIKKEIDHALQDVFADASFSGGPFVERFEEEFARAHNVKFCIAVIGKCEDIYGIYNYRSV